MGLGACHRGAVCSVVSVTVINVLSLRCSTGYLLLVIVCQSFFHCFYRLEEPILEILYGAITVFTRSTITMLKVNRFR